MCVFICLCFHTHERLWPYNITENKTVCLLAIAANFLTLLNLTGLVTCPVSNMDCLEETDLLARPQVSDPLPDIILLKKPGTAQLPVCVINIGSPTIGEMTQHLCKTIFMFCPPGNETRCMGCCTNTNCAHKSTLKVKECKFKKSERLFENCTHTQKNN